MVLIGAYLHLGFATVEEQAAIVQELEDGMRSRPCMSRANGLYNSTCGSDVHNTVFFAPNYSLLS